MSNVFSGICNVSKDAEVRQTQAGSVLSVNLANNVGFGDKQQVIWIQASVWGRRAEGQLASFLLKGQQVFVSGELSQDSYIANDGTQKTSFRLNCTTIDLIGKKSDNPQPAKSYQPPHEAHRQAVAQHENQPPYDDDIPF